MARFIATIHDERSGRDAFLNVDLPLVTNPEIAKYVLDAELAGCQFEITDVSPVAYIPLEFAAEVNLDNYLATVGEC